MLHIVTHKRYRGYTENARTLHRKHMKTSLNEWILQNEVWAMLWWCECVEVWILHGADGRYRGRGDRVAGLTGCLTWSVNNLSPSRRWSVMTIINLACQLHSFDVISLWWWREPPTAPQTLSHTHTHTLSHTHSPSCSYSPPVQHKAYTQSYTLV